MSFMFYYQHLILFGQLLFIICRISYPSLSFSLFASDFGSLAEHVKDGSGTSVQQSQQQVHGIQSQMTTQAQAALRLKQQVCLSPVVYFIIGYLLFLLL